MNIIKPRVSNERTEGYMSILEQAMQMVRDAPMHQLTKTHLATKCGITHPTINWYFGSVDGLKTMIVREALDRDDKLIIARAIVENMKEVEHLTRDQRARALKSLI